VTDPRKPIFDAVRAAAPAGLFNDPGNVLALDNLLDAWGIPRDSASGHRLGSLSERYESGGRGPGTVSSGKGDPGGVSYGLYQLASKTGTVAAFIAAEGKRWALELDGFPGTAEFTAAWKAIAAREPAAFADAQHAFIERTHYRPCVDKVKTRTGLDLDRRPDAVRDVVWSCAVQHGRAADIICTAIAKVDAMPGRNSKDYDRSLIGAIYDARTAYVKKLMVGAASGAAATFRTLIDSRYPDEREKALEMLA